MFIIPTHVNSKPSTESTLVDVSLLDQQVSRIKATGVRRCKSDQSLDIPIDLSGLSDSQKATLNTPLLLPGSKRSTEHLSPPDDIKKYLKVESDTEVTDDEYESDGENDKMDEAESEQKSNLHNVSDDSMTSIHGDDGIGVQASTQTTITASP